MTPEAAIRQYLERSRDGLIWKLDGLSEYDIRRPMTPTGTDLLGVVKHVAAVTAGYLGDVFGRPFPLDLPWFEADAEPNADMWATADESRQDIVALWEAAWAHGLETVEELGVPGQGEVPWWPPERNPVTVHQVAVHLIAEVQRHTGHADIVREMIDGAAGLLPGVTNLPEVDAGWWSTYVGQVEAAARAAAGDHRGERAS